MSVNGANQVITAKFTAIQALEKAGDKKRSRSIKTTIAGLWLYQRSNR